MAELEIHHEAEHKIDPAGQKVGLLAAILAVGLALATIASHRAHTAAIVHQTEANDRWQYYQSTRIKFHSLELGEDILGALGNRALVDRYRDEKKRYEKRREEAQTEARAKENEAQHTEQKALRYDIGEGLLEIGLVLTSLYFISRKTLFPAIGTIAGVAGAIIAATGLLI